MNHSIKVRLTSEFRNNFIFAWTSQIFFLSKFGKLFIQKSLSSNACWTLLITPRESAANGAESSAIIRTQC